MVAAHRGARRLRHEPRGHIDRGQSDSRLIGDHGARARLGADDGFEYSTDNSFGHCRRLEPEGSDPNGIGDVLFPALGNPGIDVEHYTVVLDYDPKRRELSATEHIDLVMTQDRDMFSLDSDGPDVSSVSIDGAASQVRCSTAGAVDHACWKSGQRAAHRGRHHLHRVARIRSFRSR